MEISQSQEGERVCLGITVLILSEWLYLIYEQPLSIEIKTLRVKDLMKVRLDTISMKIAYHFHTRVLRNQFVSSHRHTGSSLQYSCLRACMADHGTDQASCDKMNESNLDENNTVITQISDT